MKPMLLVLPLLLLLGACEKVRLDQQVRELCAKDGGIKVYETVVLPPEKFEKFSNASIPSKADTKPSDEYYSESDMRYYKRGDYEEVTMWRSQYRIFRRHDDKLLGESIRYTRRGGEIPGPWHTSSFSCPPVSKDQPNLESSIFLKGDAK